MKSLVVLWKLNTNPLVQKEWAVCVRQKGTLHSDLWPSFLRWGLHSFLVSVKNCELFYAVSEGGVVTPGQKGVLFLSESNDFVLEVILEF